MTFLEKLKNEKYLILALLFALLNLIVIFLLFGFQDLGERANLVKDIYRIRGEEPFQIGIPPARQGISSPQVEAFRWFRPLGPLIALPFEFLGSGAGFILQNIFFYLFSAFLIFRIIESIFHNKEQAFWGVVLFSASLSIIQDGLGYLIDMGGWFFSILSIFLTLLYLRNRNERLIILNGFLSGLGFLMKEDGCLGILFFIMIILLAKEFSLKEKFFKILKFGIPFSIPILIFQIYMFVVFRATSLDWWLQNEAHYSVQRLRTRPGQVYAYFGKYTSVLYNYGGEFLKSFGIIGLFFSAIGFGREWLQKNRERLKIYLALVPFSLSFLLYPATNSRFAFISAPLMIILASYGLVYLKSIFPGKKGTLAVAVLALGHAVFNYYFYINFYSYRLLMLKLINLIPF